MKAPANVRLVFRSLASAPKVGRAPLSTAARSARLRLVLGIRGAVRRLQQEGPGLVRLGLGVAASGLALALVGAATSSTLLLAPFAASAALKHAAPRSPLARPRNIIGGYLVGASVGVAAGLVLGDGVLAAAAAMAVAAMVMVAAGVEHPPGVAMALIALSDPGFWPLEAALAGSITLTATMAVLSPSLHRHHYWRAAPSASAPDRLEPTLAAPQLVARIGVDGVEARAAA